MKLALLAVFLALPVGAQPIAAPGTIRTVRVTFSVQDGMAKALTGLNFTGYSSTSCSLDGQGVQLGGGAVWQAAEGLGLRLVTPHVAALASTQYRARSKWEVISVIGAELMYDFSVIMGANVIHANPASIAGKALRVGPILAEHKLTTLNRQREKIQPDPVLAFAGDALDPSAAISIASGAGVCQQRVFLAKSGGPDGGTVDIPVMVLPSPIVFQAIPVTPPGTAK